MRFVELRPTPERETFRLHPRITWLRGLDPAARVAVVGLVHDIALGEMPEWEGTVEIDGETMSLADGVAALGETADNALIVDAASLPPVTAVTDGESVPSATRESLESATEKLRELEDRIAHLAEELASSGKVRSGMTAHLVSASARVDTDAGPRLDRADGELGRAARFASRPDPWTGMDDVPARVIELREQIDELESSLAALPSGDRPALAAAVATARAAISSGSVPSPEAVALAQAWTSLHQRLTGLESRMEAAGGGTEAVAARLDAAKAAARAAEDAAVPRPITQEEADELEALHEEMLAAEHRVGRGVRRAAGRAAFEKAEAALHDALSPLGYPTWAAFRMGNGMASVSQESFDEYERSQVELEAAEIELAQLMARLERDTDLQDVLTAIDRAVDHARELLGQSFFETGSGDVARDDPSLVREALESCTVDAASIGVGRDAAISHLREAMAAAGAGGHEHLTSDAALVALGESWLGVLGAADEAAVRMLRDRERAADELAALEELGDGTRVDRLDDERAAVRAAEKDVAETRNALAEVVEARMQLHVLAATELNLAEEHDDRLLQRESAQVLVDLATRRLDGRASVDDAAALADRVPRGVGGPVPVVIVMGASHAEVLDRLVVLPDDVQILVIGDGDGLAEWIDRAGEDTAATVDVGTLV
jgi:hypothetical protein